MGLSADAEPTDRDGHQRDRGAHPARRCVPGGGPVDHGPGEDHAGDERPQHRRQGQAADRRQGGIGVDPQADVDEHRADTREHQDDQSQPTPATIDEHEGTHQQRQHQVELDLELEGPGRRERPGREQRRVVVLEEQQVAERMLREVLVSGQQGDAHEGNEVGRQQARHPSHEVPVDRDPAAHERTRDQEAGQHEEDEDAPVAVLEQPVEGRQATAFARHHVVAHDRDGRERPHGIQALIPRRRV